MGEYSGMEYEAEEGSGMRKRMTGLAIHQCLMTELSQAREQQS